MTVKFTDPESGEEKEYYTADELAAKDTEVASAAAAAAEANRKYDDLQKIHASQAENFKSYKNMTEEEKSQLSAEKTEMLKRIDEAASAAEAANAKLALKEEAEANAQKSALVQKYTGGDKDLAAKFEEKFETLSGVADMGERAQAAAVLAGIGTQSQQFNPLNQQFNGESPQLRKSNGEKQEFFESDKGKAGLEMMKD